MNAVSIDFSMFHQLIYTSDLHVASPSIFNGDNVTECLYPSALCSVCEAGSMCGCSAEVRREEEAGNGVGGGGSEGTCPRRQTLLTVSLETQWYTPTLYVCPFLQ